MKRSRDCAGKWAGQVAVKVVAGATMMLLVGVAPARAQVTGPTPPPDIDCPAGTNKYVTPREVNVERGGLVLPPTLKVSRPLYTTALVLAPGRLHIDKYVSWDGYLARASSPVQPQERWAIRVGGVSTGLTDDLTDGVIEDTKTGSLGFIDQPGGVVEYVHSSLYLGVPPFDTDSVHPSGFCWTLDPTPTISTTTSTTTSTSTTTTVPSATTTTTVPSATTTTTVPSATTTTTVPSATTTTTATPTTAVPTTSTSTTTTTSPRGTVPPNPPAFAVATTSTTVAPAALASPPAPVTAAATLPTPSTIVRPSSVADVAPSSAPAVQVLGTEIINSTTGALAVTGSDDVRNSVWAVSLIAVGVALVSLKRLRRR